MPLGRTAAGVAGLLVLATLLALVVPRWLDPDPPPGVSVNGREPVAGAVVADLDRPLVVDGQGDAAVRLTAFGLPVGGARGQEPFELTLGQFLPGPVQLTVEGRGTVLVRPADADLGAVVRWSPLLLLLFAAAYAEQVLRRVRRRRRSGTGEVAALAGVGAVAGLALLLASWVLAGVALPGLVAIAVLAVTAAAGALLAPLQAAATRRSVGTR